MANSYFSIVSTILITDRSLNGGLASQTPSNSQIKSLGYIKLLILLIFWFYSLLKLIFFKKEICCHSYSHEPPHYWMDFFSYIKLSRMHVCFLSTWTFHLSSPLTAPHISQWKLRLEREVRSTFVWVSEQELKAKHCSCHYATVFLKCSCPKT